MQMRAGSRLLAIVLLCAGAVAQIPSFNWSPWKNATPESVGLKIAELDEAREYINTQILDRQCLLLIKNGSIVYEWYDPTAPDPPLTPKHAGPPATKLHKGYSMTKTVGGYLVLYISTQLDSFDIDAGITVAYGVPSPKAYEVTLRMMMAQVIGGEDRPGDLWRYDELGNMWLHLFPKVIEAATGKKASYWLDLMQRDLGLSNDTFSWPTVDSDWFRGASATCRDWGRFGQLILNKGSWYGRQLISLSLMNEMQTPVKYAPDNSYSNPCYGLLIWLNSDKQKYPGCCWEASRLPEPKCNDKTFIDGAPHDLTFNIGLYGQIVMTLPSADAVVVGFGRDLRPIEPARLGYYPGVCKALGLPCSKPEPAPQTRCGEMLQCTGVSAQCFSGGAWGHMEPYPGKQQCVDCFRNRLWKYEKRFPEAHYMVQNWCPQSSHDAFKFIDCFCGLNGTNANPFSPWSSTTTTTPAPSPATPCPHPYPAPSPPAPAPLCGFTSKCVAGLENFNPTCRKPEHNGGHSCYLALRTWGKKLSTEYGCPDFSSDSRSILLSGAFCWCGVSNSESSDYSTSSEWNASLTLPLHSHTSEGSFGLRSSVSGRRRSDCRKNLGGRGCCRDAHDARATRHKNMDLLTANCLEQTVDCDPNITVSDGNNSYSCNHDLNSCTADPKCKNKCVCKYSSCIESKTGMTNQCAKCFGSSMSCTAAHCVEQCACYNGIGKPPAECKKCQDQYCKPGFQECSGVRPRSDLLDWMQTEVVGNIVV